MERYWTLVPHYVIVELLMIVRSTFSRLRGGSREDVPGQWTCSQCFAPLCWPVRKRCYRCGAAQDDLPVSSKGKGIGKVDVAVGPLGRKPPPTAGNVPPTTRRPQVVPPRGPPGAGVGSPPTPESPPSPLKSWSRHFSSFRVS